MEEDPEMGINVAENRYPYCIVWTPIPLLTWICPLIGHMGICTSAGIIRDFGGSYYVGKDRMAFGNPTRYWQLDPNRALNSWDQAVESAAETYQSRIHNLCCDNCHSMVALALNKMHYDEVTSWNMVELCFFMFLNGKFVSKSGYLKTYVPFWILLFSILMLALFVN